MHIAYTVFALKAMQGLSFKADFVLVLYQLILSLFSGIVNEVEFLWILWYNYRIMNKGRC